MLPDLQYSDSNFETVHPAEQPQIALGVSIFRVILAEHFYHAILIFYVDLYLPHFYRSMRYRYSKSSVRLSVRPSVGDFDVPLAYVVG